MDKFKELGLSMILLDSITKLKFDEPTEIQRKTIPSILKGKDIIGESATGSGKTLAFGVGIVQNITNEGLQALVLTPTRELAEQVKNSLKELGNKLNIISIYGGVAINPQIHQLRKANVVVATPGRLLDHLQRRTIDTSKIKILVLDEADRMLDMGFIQDVERIIKSCPNKKQILLFSATINHDLKKLSSRYLKNPVTFRAVNQVDPKKLKQIYYEIKKNQKLSLIIHLLKNEKSGLVMVFCNTRRTTDFVVNNLKANKIDAIAIHGGLTQNKRGRIIKSFNDSKVHVLVCTDVASRGLHIDNVSHIYNYEIPKDATDYVHRIGRTARAGEEGIVINLLSSFDYDNFGRILHEYRFTIDKTSLPSTERIIAIRKENNPRGRNNRFRHRDSRFGGNRNHSQRNDGPSNRFRGNRGSRKRSDGPRNSIKKNTGFGNSNYKGDRGNKRSSPYRGNKRSSPHRGRRRD